MKRAFLLLALGVPTSLAGQSAITTVSSYVSADDGISSAPTLLGLNVARQRGWMAVRMGASIDAGSTFSSSSAAGSTRMKVLTGDLDAMIYLGSPSSTSAVVPYVLAGIGGRALSGATSESALNWGYGAGARAPISDRISFDGEVRYREPITAIDALGQSAGLEYRAGISLRLSGSRAPRRAPVPTAPIPRSVSAPIAADAGSAAAARLRVATRALDLADDFLGVRYTWGGNTPEQGFDCSGFIKYVFDRQGITLPRVSRDQARAGTPVPIDIAAFEPGDLIAFAPEPGAVVDHIAIYAGNGQIIHSSSSGKGVRFDDLYSQRGEWYRTHMVAVRRVIDTPLYFASE